MEEIEVISLFKKYLAKKCTDKEIRLLMHYLQQDQYAPLIKELIADDLQHNNDDVDFDEQALLAMQKTDEYFEQEFFKKKKSGKIKYLAFKIAVAATVIFIASITIWLHLNQTDHPLTAQTIELKSTLYTSDGTAIKLDGTTNTDLFQQNGAIISQDSLGNIHVKIADSVLFQEAEPVYQTIRTAKGKQSRIYLADGSCVVLNSASELKFPLFYALDQREVELQGEAFFEVETDPKKPFYVKTHDQLIKVYGTQFNVSNYADDQKTQTTLFHGKVSVQNLVGTAPQKEFILKPGEQATIDKKSKVLKQDRLDSEDEVLGWKNGFFVYDNTPLQDIMKDFMRWYDIEVDLETLPTLTFSGTISRNYDLDKALNIIAKTASIKLTKTGSTIKFEN